MTKSDWWRTYFDEGYVREYEPLFDLVTDRQQVARLIELLQLESGARIADVQCGQGRHAHLLAEAGFDVDGLDLSAHLIDFDGAGRTIDASAAGGTGLSFIAHQRVRVRNVAVVNAADVGVAVLVPTTASGVVSIDLDIVTVSGNAGHGVLINDRRSTSRTPTPPRTPDRMRRSTRRSAPSAPCRTPSVRSTAMASASTKAGPGTWRSA